MSRRRRAPEAEGGRPFLYDDPRIAAALAAGASPNPELARERFHERLRELSGCDLDELAEGLRALLMRPR